MVKWMGARGEGYVIIQLILFGLIWFVPGKVNEAASWPPFLHAAGLVVGGLFMVTGAMMVLVALLNLGHNLTAVPHPKTDAELVQSGVYALVRHPIYSGIIMGALGLGFWRNGEITLLLALILFLFFDIKSRQEERWLLQKFPEYTRYQQQTRKLLPFIY